MCVRSWGLVRNREFMGGQELGVNLERRPIYPKYIMTDGPTYTWGSGLSRKMYLLQARRLNARQAWMGPPSRCRAPH
jgi:hypothetical protein